MTEAFGDRGISCGYSPDSIRSTLYEIEEGFRKCNDILADIDIEPCSYVFQTAAIDQMVEELEVLKSYAQEAPEHVYEVLDHPLYVDFKNHATESLSQIVLEDLETENIIGMEEYGKVSPTSRATKPSTQVKKSLKFRDFLDVEGLERAAGQQVLSNLDSVYEFAVLFREDYDRMKEKNIQTCIEKYLTSGEYDHKAYHPVKDFLSGLLDYTIVKPIIECCCCTDLITGERLNETEKAVKLAGAAVDLFTLGQGMIALKGSGLVGKELYKCLGKLTMVEGVSGAAAYTVGYGAGELGVPPQITWMLSVATGCAVSVAGTKIVFRDIDTGIELEYGIEELEGLGSLEGPEGWDDIRYEMYWRRILNGEDTSHPGMSDLDYALWKYGEKKVDEYIALSKVDAEELIRLRVEERIRYVGESGTGERLIPGMEGVVTGGDSTKLGKNMMESMGLPRETNWTGHQAQHIIPAEMANHPVLQRIGMDLDDTSNGLFLRTPADDISTMSRHRGYHSTYNEFVKTELDAMDISQSVGVLQKRVYDLQQNLKYLQQSGLPLYPSQGATVDLWQRSLERIQ